MRAAVSLTMAFGAMASGCMSSPEAASPIASASEVLPAGDGAALYRQQCGICHGAGGFGTNMLTRRLGPTLALIEQRVIDAAYVRAVVRGGIGDMPPFTRVELPDPSLEAVALYLAQPRAEPPR